MPQTIPGKSFFQNRFGVRKDYPKPGHALLENADVAALRHAGFIEQVDVVDTASGEVSPVSVESIHGGADALQRLLARHETRTDGVRVRTHMLPDEWARLTDEERVAAGFLYARPAKKADEPKRASK